ncbi:hypothetical protein FACS1894193_04180 [Bacilli bacterium]|nr:hypothetical protein FACS1894193_04180 [Bacilli bacterium]
MSQKVRQDDNRYNRYKILTILTIILAIILVVSYETSLVTCLKKGIRRSRSESITRVKEKLISDKLDLISMQNGREIKLTKLVATKKKLLFNYQFKLDDDRLKALLDKQLANGSNYQDISFSLFSSNDRTNNLVEKGLMTSTFRIKGNTFYGTVGATFNSDQLSDDTKLALQISKLAWDEHQVAGVEPSKAGSSSTVPTTLQYDGDWHFDIIYQPLVHTVKPQIMQVKNIEDIKADSDVLQTTVKFTAPFKKDEAPELEIYKDGVKVDTSSFIAQPQGDKMAFELSFDMSKLDKTSVYKMQVNSVNATGQEKTEIGAFSMKHKLS